MEVVAIPRSVLDGMNDGLRELLKMTETAGRKYAPTLKGEKWLDNQEVCSMLDITKRTLHSYRDKGLLLCSKLNRKNYYKLSDVQALLDTDLPNKTDTYGPVDR